jgi:hypothetical protein
LQLRNNWSVLVVVVAVQAVAVVWIVMVVIQKMTTARLLAVHGQATLYGPARSYRRSVTCARWLAVHGGLATNRPFGGRFAQEFKAWLITLGYIYMRRNMVHLQSALQRCSRDE